MASNERAFCWHHNPGKLGDNNDGEINELLEKGWRIYGFSDPVVVDGKATVFVNLVFPQPAPDEDEDEDDDSEIE